MTIKSDLRTAPRDCVVVTSDPNVAKIAEDGGRLTILQGRDFHNFRDLRDNWSTLSKRVGQAQVIGPPWLCEAVAQLCQTSQINTSTGARRSRRWTEHTLRNLPLLTHEPPGLREGGLAGMPAFIVGAGPSLDKNAHLIPEAMKRGVVMRVNSGTVVPGQVAVCIESNDVRHKLHVTDDVRLFGVSCPPAVMREVGTGPLRPIWAGEIAWIPEMLTGIPRLPTSGSGTTAAVMAARLWGCSPIVLVGQDLSMPDGKVYADITGHGDDRIERDGRYKWGTASASAPRPNNPLSELEPVEQAQGWGGRGQVMCGITQRMLRTWLATAAEQIEAPTFNCTEGGATIRSWYDQPLRKVLDMLPEREDTDVENIAHRIASALLPMATLFAWLAEEAPDLLAEAWAMPDVVAYLLDYRHDQPGRFGPLERRRVLEARATLQALRESARADVARICSEVRET